jgi:hypothetical protein
MRRRAEAVEPLSPDGRRRERAGGLNRRVEA